MADHITLTGLRVLATHGVLPEERRRVQPFVLDVRVQLDLQRASASDELEATVHYGELAQTVGAAAGAGPFNLLERLGGHVADAVLERFAQVTGVEVTVHKPQAPVAADVADVAVTIGRRR